MSQTSKKPKVQISRRGVVVWCALGFFIMSWMFVLGIMVGRGTALIPVRSKSLDKELNDLRSAMLNKSKADAEKKAGSKEGELGFYEALKKTPSREVYKITPPSPPPKKTENAAAPAPSPLVVQKKDESPAAAAPSREETGLHEHQPAAAHPGETAEKKPAPAVKTAEPAARADEKAGRYTIQLAAYKDLQSAEKMVGLLRAKGYPGYSLRAEIKGQGAWYRVRVGAFPERASAEAMLRRLESDRFKGMVVGTQ